MIQPVTLFVPMFFASVRGEKGIDIYDKMSYNGSMILIGRKTIVEFARYHPHSRNPLSAWEKVVKQTNYKSFNELKRTFPSADYVGHHYTIFNIGGNKYRLITEVDYAARVVHIKRVWTHAEYSMKKNEDAIKRGKL